MKDKGNYLLDIIEWDVYNWSVILSVWKPVLDKLPKESKVLAIGERNGGMATWLALNGFRVLCTDREGPTQKAREKHEQLGVSDRIEYASLDIMDIQQEYLSKYDLIIAKSVIGGVKFKYNDPSSRSIQSQIVAVQNICSMLHPGGVFLSAENLEGHVFLQIMRALKKKNKGWRYLNVDELQDIYSCFHRNQFDSFGIIPGRNTASNLNRIIFHINRFLSSFFPSSAKYISIVTATKT